MSVLATIYKRHRAAENKLISTRLSKQKEGHHNGSKQIWVQAMANVTCPPFLARGGRRPHLLLQVAKELQQRMERLVLLLLPSALLDQGSLPLGHPFGLGLGPLVGLDDQLAVNLLTRWSSE